MARAEKTGATPKMACGETSLVSGIMTMARLILSQPHKSK